MLKIRLQRIATTNKNSMSKTINFYKSHAKFIIFSKLLLFFQILTVKGIF